MKESTQINGRPFWCDNETEAGINYLRDGINYEIHIRKELQRLLPTANAFLDIGANCGIHTVSAKEINPGLWVGAFEGSPENVNFLCQNLEDYKEVQVYPVVLADRPRIVCRNGCWWNTTFHVEHVEHESMAWTAALPLDHIKLPFVDVIKIDVEGFEWLVLRGASAVLMNNPHIIFEFYPQAMRNAKSDPLGFLEWLESFGYKFTVLDYIPNTRHDCRNSAEVMEQWAKHGRNLTDVLASPT